MADKLNSYLGTTGRLHNWKMDIKARWKYWVGQSNNNESMQMTLQDLSTQNSHKKMQDADEYSHVYRRKTNVELLRLCCSVMGIEFAYAAETAFVTPALLQIGVPHMSLSLVWALSPMIGFLAGPLLGSMSDRCSSRFGRRRPFIVALALLVILGLLLIPNGEELGKLIGDHPAAINRTIYKSIHPHRISASKFVVVSDHLSTMLYHKWGIAITILGTLLLDFASDASQNPTRAYLVDMCIPEDHARGLSSFTILAGIGGMFGYSLGAINWDDTFLGIMLGGHIRAVFTLVCIIFTICVLITINSFKEIPLADLQKVNERAKKSQSPYDIEDGFRLDSIKLEDESNQPISMDNIAAYGSIKDKSPYESDVHQRPIPIIINTPPSETSTEKSNSSCSKEEEHISLSHYLMTILNSPKSIRMICVTNLFCWMAHVCYSLYFTDFVGEAVFFGDPKAPVGTKTRKLFEEGVRFGCWGMATYSLCCSFYSMMVSKLIQKYGTKTVYVGGLLVYSAGMSMMAFFRNRFVVILLSGTAGIMYSTLFTMPYLLIAKYHNQNTFEMTADGEPIAASQRRGLGTDIALAGSMVFVAQLVLSLCVGTLVSYAGTTAAVIAAASALALCGAAAATRIMYLD